MNSDNPLLPQGEPVDYSRVRPEHLLAAVGQVVSDNRKAIDAVIASQRVLPTWDDLVLAVDALDARLNNTLYNIAPLLSLAGDWKDAAQQCWDLAQAYLLEKLHNPALLSVYERLAASPHGMALDWQSKVALQRTLKLFTLSGVHLSDSQRQRIQAIDVQISALQSEFFDNLEHSRDSWTLHITDKQRLMGVPEFDQATLAAQAKDKGLSGWLVTRNAALCLSIVEHAHAEELREVVYRALSTYGAHSDPQRDNGRVLQALSEARFEKARLLGFDSFAQLTLQRKGGASPQQVSMFLKDLARQAKPGLVKEQQRLQHYAHQQGLAHIQPWNVTYLHKRANYTPASLSADDVRACFTLDKVIQALVDLARELFGVVLSETPAVTSWHPAVRVFQVEQDHATLGYLYIDAVARDGKEQNAAWTYYLSNRHTNAEGIYQKGAAALFTSVTPGRDGQPPLLSHLDLRMLYHEFGHCLHHLLVSTTNYHLSDLLNLGPGGFEVTSQLLERWCWSAPYLARISAHYQDGKPLAIAALQTFLDQHQAQERSKLAPELAKALFDLDLHGNVEDGRTAQQRVKDSFVEAGAWPLAGFERPLHAFDHLASGYEAGYFGYLWANVYAFDLFSRFEQPGLDLRATGQALQDEVFAYGAARSMQSSVEAFLKRPMSAVPFLRWYGLID